MPELDKLIQMSQAFDISLGWLVNEEEQQKAAEQNSKSTEEIKQTVKESNDSTSKEIRKGNQSLIMLLMGVMIIAFVLSSIRFNRLENKLKIIHVKKL